MCSVWLLTYISNAALLVYLMDMNVNLYFYMCTVNTDLLAPGACWDWLQPP